MDRLRLLITGGLPLGVVASVLLGCGSSKPAPQPAPVNAAQTGNAAPAIPAPVGPAVPNVAQPVNAREATKPDLAADGTAAEPPGADEFVLTTDQIITEVVTPAPSAPPPAFEVSAIPPGTNSSNLVLATADSNAGSGNPGTYPNAVPANGTVPMPMVGSVAGASGTGGEGWALPKEFTAVLNCPLDPETGLPTRIKADRDAVEMVLIPPGVFLQGADGADSTVAPQHTVLLENPYYIDTVEVTVARYNAFREFFRKTEGKKLDPSVNHDGNPEMPAVGIKFFDAKYYAKWTGKELPTEAQWERAARGDKGFEQPWGEGRAIFHLPRVPGQIDTVAKYPADRSPYGLFDMSGNAREWCLDVYQADIYQKEVTASAGTVRNPTGPKSAPGIKQQVVRGSSTDWILWHRTPVPQNETAPDIGFRCVLNLASSKPKTDKAEKGPTKKADEKKKAAPKL